MPSLSPRIVLATTNRGKLTEFRALLAPYDVEVLAADEVAPGWSVVEDGVTFEANARLKAADLAGRAGLPALGDDSGLEVFALGGQPGVRSARYAGEGASDANNVAQLLQNMRDVPDGERGAAFRCALALAWPDASPAGEHGHSGGRGRAPHIVEASGRCEGMIARAPSGHGGFGYDPVFVDPETGRTFAELTAAEKNERSHRRRAVEALCAALERQT